MGPEDLNPLSALITSTLTNTVGRVVNGVVRKYLPASMSEAEKAQVELALRQGFVEELKIDADTIESVNKTIRAEAQSDKWWQSAWRPTVGFTFSAVIINNYIVMAYLAKWAQPIDIPSGVWNSMLVILGAAAGTRGIEKIANKIKDRWKRNKQ